MISNIAWEKKTKKTEQTRVMEQRDHLFISYATEDSDLADWLTLKLTGEGYKVWCDRIKLLGGESYPQDIDKALEEQTFRLIALLSESSKSKPNPTKERTKALNIARARKEEFFIPLNVDGLAPDKMDWMSSDITFIPFMNSWAKGFYQLLEKLNKVGAPKSLLSGRETVCQWFSSQAAVETRKERLRSNIFQILDIPQKIIQYNLKNTPGREVVLKEWTRKWPIFYQSDEEVWALLMYYKSFPDRWHRSRETGPLLKYIIRMDVIIPILNCFLQLMVSK